MKSLVKVSLPAFIMLTNLKIQTHRSQILWNNFHQIIFYNIHFVKAETSFCVLDTLNQARVPIYFFWWAMKSQRNFTDRCLRATEHLCPMYFYTFWSWQRAKQEWTAARKLPLEDPCKKLLEWPLVNSTNYLLRYMSQLANFYRWYVSRQRFGHRPSLLQQVFCTQITWNHAVCKKYLRYCFAFLLTVMYPAYAKWVQSHRDLPIRLNQWCNVVVSKQQNCSHRYAKSSISNLVLVGKSLLHSRDPKLGGL